MAARTRLHATLHYFGCIVYSVLEHFLFELKQLFDLESEHRQFVFKIMTQFYLAVLRRSRETVRKKRPPLRGNMSGSFTTTTLPHKHALSVQSFSQVTELQFWSPLYWHVTQRTTVVPYRRFGTTYRFHLQGSSSPENPWRLDQEAVPRCR